MSLKKVKDYFNIPTQICMKTVYFEFMRRICSHRVCSRWHLRVLRPVQLDVLLRLEPVDHDHYQVPSRQGPLPHLPDVAVVGAAHLGDYGAKGSIAAAVLHASGLE